MIGVLEAVGYAIVAGTAVEALLGLSGTWRRAVLERRAAAIETGLFERRVEMSLRRAEAERDLAGGTWTGFRKLKVASKTLEADGIHSFELVAHNGRPLPPFMPGQYLTFQLRIPGHPKPLVRCYSLSDAPGQGDRYRISVKKVEPPAGVDCAPGVVSSYFNDVVEEGDILDVRAPSGAFCCDPVSEQPLVLIAGGIGITPVLSMLNAVCADPGEREVWLFYGVRNRRQHAFAAHIAGLRKRYPSLHVVTVYSDPTPDCVEGEDYDRIGRIDLEVLKAHLPSSNYAFYICGPAPMMEVVSSDLRAWGVPSEDVRIEAFGAATVQRQPHESAAIPAGGIEVVFDRTEKTVTWDGSLDSILDLAERNGIALESGCRAGHCGTCTVAIKEGVVDYIAKPVEVPERGTCLACISVPKSRLVLDG